MNKLVFFTENDKVQTELQECVPVKNIEDQKLKCFNATKKPSYLRIFFEDEIREEELAQVYYHMINYDLIETEKSIGEMARDDMEFNHWSMKGSAFEIKCYNFRNAFMCAVDIMGDFKEPGIGGWITNRVSVMLSDEPSEKFMQIMEHKGNE